ncbi:mechanosensitive ion channel family protein [Cobetia marina]|uniref:mechanosensitive ion channel family protein n=1 Tax=Cobetia marina TaxID=28258 RepID=UPI002547129E|nr:mechanosensitive ion channel family protein [Cobetia pacifica]MDI6004001.1 mechanosensitive ion channel family protein [Cobetia pacifica]
MAEKSATEAAADKLAAPAEEMINHWVEPLRNWVEQTFGLPLWGINLALVLVAVIVLHLSERILLSRLAVHAEKSRNLWDDALLHGLRHPLSLWLYSMGSLVALDILAHQFAPGSLEAYLGTVRQIITLLALAWALIRMIKRFESLRTTPPPGTNVNAMDATTASAISKLLRAVVIVLVGLAILQNLGVSLSGVMAFGGVGGIAVGFAARDLLANFFGALMIHLDRPFKVGDWIRSPDREIEGTVEDIGWRLTRIRTFDMRPLYIPNAIFTSIAVENPSRMYNRRIFETIGLRYEDATRVGDIITAVREMVEGHDEIDQTRTQIVNFNSYGEHSLDFFVYVFTRTTDWVKYHAIKQDVLLRIHDIIREHDARVALPGQRLHFADVLSLEGAAPQGDTNADRESSPRRPQDEQDGKAAEASPSHAAQSGSRRSASSSAATSSATSARRGDEASDTQETPDADSDA